MSRKNVELVKRLYATMRALPDLRDTSLEDDRAFLERIFGDYIDEQFEIHLPPDYPEGEPVFRGREGSMKMLAMLRDAWGEFRCNRNASSMPVTASSRSSGSMLRAGRGVPIELETTHVWTVRTGRVMSMHAYRDCSQALEAAGLRE